MPPIQARLSRMTWLERLRPHLFSGDFSAPKRDVGSVEVFTLTRPQFPFCLCPSCRFPPTLHQVAPSQLFAHTLRSQGTETFPRPGLQDSALAPALSLELSCFEKLFWHILSNIFTCLWLKEESVLAQSDKFLETSLFFNF